MVDDSRDEELALLRRALHRISRWHGEFPESGRFWDEPPEGSSTRPMSYGTAYGSNGERDYMRRVAEDALDAAAKIEAKRLFARSRPVLGNRHFYREIGEGQDWVACSQEAYERYQSDPHMDTYAADPVVEVDAFTFPQPQRTRLYEVLRRLGERAIRSQKITDHEAASAAQREAIDAIEGLVQSLRERQ